MIFWCSCITSMIQSHFSAVSRGIFAGLAVDFYRLSLSKKFSPVFAMSVSLLKVVILTFVNRLFQAIYELICRFQHEVH